MDDTPPKENPPADFNKIDLAQLQSFSFGTQWTQDKSSPSDRREPRDRDDRPRRDGPGGGPGGAPRDRRAFRRPAGAPGGPGPGSGPGPGGPSGAPESREFQGDRRPQRGPGEYRGGGAGGGYRGPQGGPGGPGGDRGERPRYGAPREQIDRGPYDSPFFGAVFYPEDSSFNALVKTIRSSARTIELFEIARTVVGKADRFVVVVGRKAPNRPAEGAAPVVEPVYISVPDGLPFESDEAAVAHVMATHVAQFFDSSEVETEAPKGNFQVVNRDTITGELLGPPNYHRYGQIIQQHFATKVSRISFDQFKSRIESVRDPEAIAQWLEKMKKVTRYTWKLPVAEGAPVPTFDSLEEARVFLLTTARDKVVRAAETARFHGKALETLPQGEIRRAIEGALERQRRFPLDTANTLRGRLRREHFTIFKKGSKGVSYVCAVKRKFRVPGQTFSESIGNLISFVEAHPLIKASELAKKFLNIVAPEALAPVAGETPVEPSLSVEQREKIARMQGDLVWLVREGYVTEFIDGGLYAPPPMAEARKKEAELNEVDPESFPEAPAAPAAEAIAPVAETPLQEPTPAAAEATPEIVTPPAPEPPAPEPPAAEVPAAEAPASDATA